MHLQLISASSIAPTVGMNATPFPGDSLTILNANMNKPVDIVALWQTNQVAGFGQIAFPSGHDTTRGFRTGVPIGVAPALLALGQRLPIQPQELMTITLAGSGVAGDVEQLSMLIRYVDMPGISGRYITAKMLDDQRTKMTTIEQSITSVAGPGYTGEVVINTTSDLLLANRDYAVIGMTSRTAVHAMTLRGPDLGNVRIGVPGVLRQELTSQWFSLLSRAFDEPMIPVINSGNKTSTFIGVATDENAGTFVVTLHLALLK